MRSNLPEVLKSKTPKVYKNKKLNNANFGEFTHNEYQVFLHLVSKIGGVDEFGKYLQPEQLQREYLLSAKEFSNLFNVSVSNCYGVLKKAVDKLIKTDIRVEEIGGSGFWRINVCSKAEYKSHEGSILIKFTDDIMPYLAQVKQKFVLYNLKEITNFGSLYTTRLYELIQEFKETGWVVKSVGQLREAFAVGDKFKAYKDFKKCTFGHACQEINDNYDIGLNFEEIKEGKKVVAIKFFFKKIIANPVINKKSGQKTIIYEKPKAKLSAARKRAKSESGKLIISEQSQEQLPFVEQKQEPKSIGSIISAILAKFSKWYK